MIGINGTTNPVYHPRSLSTPIDNNQTISEFKFGLNYKLPPGLFFGFF